jgi:hypothetical protein
MGHIQAPSRRRARSDQQANVLPLGRRTFGTNHHWLWLVRPRKTREIDMLAFHLPVTEMLDPE